MIDGDLSFYEDLCIHMTDILRQEEITGMLVVRIFSDAHLLSLASKKHRTILRMKIQSSNC